LVLTCPPRDGDKRFLVKHGNVKAASITAKSFGEENSIAPNTKRNGSDNSVAGRESPRLDHRGNRPLRGPAVSP
jgi:hypothetical protein